MPIFASWVSVWSCLGVYYAIAKVDMCQGYTVDLPQASRLATCLISRLRLAERRRGHTGLCSRIMTTAMSMPSVCVANGLFSAAAAFSDCCL